MMEKKKKNFGGECNRIWRGWLDAAARVLYKIMPDSLNDDEDDILWRRE